MSAAVLLPGAGGSNTNTATAANHAHAELPIVASVLGGRKRRAEEYLSGVHHLQQQQHSGELTGSASSPAANSGYLHKRTRLYASSPQDHQSQRFRQHAFQRLREAFPEMDDQVVARALEVNGNDIDAAIRSLTELRLAAGAPEGSAAAAEVVEKAATAVADNTATVATPTRPEAPASRETAAEEGLPKTAEEWVDTVVQEMSQSRDLDDARSRAAQLLEAFERMAKGAAMQETEALRAHVQTLERNNTILKRAVAIQASRQGEQEQQAHEVQELRKLVAQYQEQLQAAQVSNYSLSMHLRQAIDHQTNPSQRNPDVF